MNFRAPGSLCQELGEWTHEVKDGTLAKTTSPRPGAVGGETSHGQQLLTKVVSFLCGPTAAAPAMTAASKKPAAKKGEKAAASPKEPPPSVVGAHVLAMPESYIGKAYPNDEGSHECVAFARSPEVSSAPQTKLWKPGDHVEPGKPIKKGTWIATFVIGRYQGHVGVFESIDDKGNLTLIDQWKPRNKVDRTTYHVKPQPYTGSISNDPSKYYVVLW